MSYPDPNWIAALIALAALGFSIFAHQSAQKSKVAMDELERQNARLATMQTLVAHRAWSDEYFREIGSWASDVTKALSKAIHFADLLEDEQIRCDICIELSWAIDTGRWFFPNEIKDEHGQNNPPAYKGYRQPILDWLHRGYFVVSKHKLFPNPRDALIEVQRNFVSQIQARLDPRTRDASIRQILEEYKNIAQLTQLEAPNID